MNLRQHLVLYDSNGYHAGSAIITGHVGAHQQTCSIRRIESRKLPL